MSDFVTLSTAWQADLIDTISRENWRPFQPNKKRNFEDIAKVSRKMADVVRHEKETYTRQRLIEKLRFLNMRDRQQNISHAHAKTFRWVYKRKQRSGSHGAHGHLADWLHRVNGIFWITGKPASGKSTLMKYIEESPRTDKLLQGWASPGTRLVKCRHFFWRAR